MTYEEALKVLAILKSAYPTDYPYNMSKEDAKATAIVWCEQFLEIPGYIVELAIKKLIATEEKPFAPAKVKKKLGNMYWESQAKLDEARRNICPVPMSKEELMLYENIKKATEQYHYNRTIEPSIGRLVGEDTKTLLLGGKVSDG